MRWYRLNCVRLDTTSTLTCFCTIVVCACGVGDACAKAREEGYWPTSVVTSAWTKAELYN